MPQQSANIKRYSGGIVAIDWIYRTPTPEEHDHGEYRADGSEDYEYGYRHPRWRPELCCWQKFPGSLPCPLHDAEALQRVEREDTACCRSMYASNLPCAIHDRDAAGHGDLISSQTTVSSGPAYSLMIGQGRRSPSPGHSRSELARSYSVISFRSLSFKGPYGNHDQHNDARTPIDVQRSRTQAHIEPPARRSPSVVSFKSITLNSTITDSPEWGTGNTSVSCLDFRGGRNSYTMVQSQILGQPVSWDNPVHVDTSPRGASPPPDTRQEDLWPELGTRSPTMLEEREMRRATIETWLRGRRWSEGVEALIVID